MHAPCQEVTARPHSCWRPAPLVSSEALNSVVSLLPGRMTSAYSVADPELARLRRPRDGKLRDLSVEVEPNARAPSGPRTSGVLGGEVDLVELIATRYR